MKAVIQRVTSASVEVDQEIVGQIPQGLLVFLGAAKGDEEDDIDYMVNKITTLRIFPDDNGKMNRSLLDIHGELLLVSQFTLLGDTQRGRRPGFDRAAPHEEARRLFELSLLKFREKGINVQTGKFGANMLVSLKNYGPVTFILDSRSKERPQENVKNI